MQRFAADGAPLSEPGVLPTRQAAATLAVEPHVLIGTGAALVLDQLQAAADVKAYPKSAVVYPDAVNMLTLIETAALVPADRPAPLYLRPPDADPPKQDQRIKRR